MVDKMDVNGCFRVGQHQHLHLLHLHLHQALHLHMLHLHLYQPLEHPFTPIYYYPLAI